MPLEQIVVLAIVQGITEFLPISSSGHLILIPELTNWSDQGLVTDVMVHVGSLFAILAYFWRDIVQLIIGFFELLRFKWNDRSRLAAYIILATIPAVITGLFLKSIGFFEQIRGIQIVAWNAIIFGILLYVSDRYGQKLYSMFEMKLPQALVIGVAQALALIPGTSRSGITITAARFLGFKREEAARFSFLLGAPAMAGAGILIYLDILERGESIPIGSIYAAILSFFSAILAIAFLMSIVKRMSFLPFVIYRLLLGIGGKDFANHLPTVVPDLFV